MQKLILTLLLALGISTAYAQTPSSILAQLGAKGVTAVGGITNYSRYLVLLGADGKINSAMIPSSSSSTGSVGQTLTDLYFIDKNGVDSTNSGSIGSPYATLNYALSQITNDAVFVFSPGVHDRAATAISASYVDHLTLVGFDSATTILDDDGIYSLAFQNSTASRVDITGITVDKISQLNNVTTVINAYNGGVLGSMSRTYSTYTNSQATLYMDPSSSVPVLSTNSTTVYSHGADKLTYSPTTTNDWTIQPVTIEEGLDSLAARTTVILDGDATGISDSNTVVALHNIPLDVPADTNDTFAIVYDHVNGKFTYLRPIDEAGATNIQAGSSDSYDSATRTLIWNTNAAGGSGGIISILSDGSVDISGSPGPSPSLSVTNILAGYASTSEVAYIDYRVGLTETDIAYIDYRVGIVESDVAYVDYRVGVLEAGSANVGYAGMTTITGIYNSISYPAGLTATNYSININPLGDAWTNNGGVVQFIIVDGHSTNGFTFGAKDAADWVTNAWDVTWAAYAGGGSAVQAAGVSSFNSRYGAVVAEEGDYSTFYTPIGVGTTNQANIAIIETNKVGREEWGNTNAGLSAAIDNRVATNDTRILDWAGADIRISDATATNQPVTKAQLDTANVAGTNFALAIGAGCSNYADTVGAAVGLGGTNLALAIGAGGSNYADTVGAAVGLGGTNFTLTIAAALSNETIIGATIAAGSEDSVTTNDRMLIITWNTNAASLENWSSFPATQVVTNLYGFDLGTNGIIYFGTNSFIQGLGTNFLFNAGTNNAIFDW